MKDDYIPGADGFMKSLKTKGIPMAIVTSSNDAKMENVRKVRPELWELTEAVLTSEHFSKSKPDPEIFLLACDALGVKPEEAVGLEDSFNGVRACKASGLYTIMVPDIIQPDDEMKGLADVILPSLKDVQAFLNLK